MSKPSPAYFAALEASKEIHKGKQFTGRFLRSHAPFIKEIIDRLECKTVLDYGCGKGQQYTWVMPHARTTIEQYWGVQVTKYDPAYPPFAKEPEGKFDLVICTHTLGTIPVSDLPWVIDRLYALAEKAIYVSERLGDARKVLGNNLLRPTDWTADDWKASIQRLPEAEITFACREIINDGKITSHWRRNEFGGWYQVKWPEGIKAMNHTWA